MPDLLRTLTRLELDCDGEVWRLASDLDGDSKPLGHVDDRPWGLSAEEGAEWSELAEVWRETESSERRSFVGVYA